MVTFIHTSDWHIGNRFIHFGRQAREQLNLARLKVVKTIFIYARKNKIPLILCAGDTIDNGQLAREEHLQALFEIIEQHPDIKVVMIAGHHDPLITNNVYQRVGKENFPKNLYLVEGNKIVTLEPMDLKIFAASSVGKNDTSNPLNWIKKGVADEVKINIGLAHYFPIKPGFAKKKGLDYLALGNLHSSKKIDEYTYYCGTPEQMEFGDEGFPLKVTIERRGAKPIVEPITGVHQYHWISEELKVSNKQFNNFRKQLGSIGHREIKRLIISGSLSPGNYITYKELLQEMKIQSHYYGIIDHVSLEPGNDDLLGIGDPYIKAVVQRLIELKNSEGILPKDTLNGVVPMSQTAVVSILNNISRGEIIEQALLKMYSHFKESIQDDRVV